jgi:hypothetical protein
MSGKEFRLALAFAAASLALAPSSIGAASAPPAAADFVAAVESALPSLFRDVNFRFQEHAGLPYYCHDVEESTDGGATWEFVQEVCEPI